MTALFGNNCLASTHASIQSRLKRIRFIGNEAPANWDAAAREHVEMVEALEKRDDVALAEVLTRHLEETWKRIRPII